MLGEGELVAGFSASSGYLPTGKDLKPLYGLPRPKERAFPPTCEQNLPNGSGAPPPSDWHGNRLAVFVPVFLFLGDPIRPTPEGLDLVAERVREKSAMSQDVARVPPERRPEAGARTVPKAPSPVEG